ncbi:7117_t:CDS:2, partial [Funneliformis caledonium]
IKSDTEGNILGKQLETEQDMQPYKMEAAKGTQKLESFFNLQDESMQEGSQDILSNEEEAFMFVQSSEDMERKNE